MGATASSRFFNDVSRPGGRSHKDCSRVRAVLDADVQLALAGDKEELARYALAKLLPLRHGAARIEHRLEELAGERSSLEEQLGEQQAELERLEQRVRGYLARQGEESGVVAALTDLVVTDEDVELELLRRRQGPEKGAA